MEATDARELELIRAMTQAEGKLNTLIQQSGPRFNKPIAMISKEEDQAYEELQQAKNNLRRYRARNWW
jgi:hypothetical protein